MFRRLFTGGVATLGFAALGVTAAAAADSYEVQSGDTLFKIAEAHDEVESWHDLAEFNIAEVPDPDLIFPGQVLYLTAEAAPASGSAGSSETSSPPPSEDTSSSGSSSSSSAPSEDTSTESAPSESSSSESSSTPESSTASAGVWDRVAECESNGDWSINTGNGYYGGLQFALSSWEWVGGQGYPHEASKEEQIKRAEILLERQGWNAWPACSRMLGLR